MQLPKDQLSLYFEVITDRDVILFKSQSVEAVELWMSIENHMTRVEYALNSVDPGDLPVGGTERAPVIDLQIRLEDSISIPVDGDEENLLALAERFLRQHATDFQSSILFFPPKARKP